MLTKNYHSLVIFQNFKFWNYKSIPKTYKILMIIVTKTEACVIEIKDPSTSPFHNFHHPYYHVMEILHSCYKWFKIFSETPFERPPWREATPLERTLGNVYININVLIFTPDERPPLLKDHFSDAKGVVSQEGFHCIDNKIMVVENLNVPFSSTRLYSSIYSYIAQYSRL